MKIIETSIPGVLIIEPKYFGDPRGFFMETFEVDRYAVAGIARPFVQDNLSRAAECCADYICRTKSRRASL
jgi:dTDP-4-dehydrorhamnose 3,5-epimerase